ncbi:MAG TPA: copper resistance CopC family protein [Beutenbergiaceae bacterium]|nr:copper resistance CopC family protein [Beutenbergiaceae bacterium]
MTTRTLSPSATPPTSTRVTRRLLAVAGATALSLLAWTTPASAHSELIGSTPGEGEAVTEAPEQVVLEFNENIQDIGAEMAIAGPDGDEVDTDAGEVDGPTFTQDLAQERPAGEYAVQWRVVSADGHPISGEFTFTADADAGTPAQEEQDEADATDEVDAAADAESEETAAAEETDPAQEEEPEDVGTPEESLEQEEGGFPWGIAFAVVAIGALLALIVRARQQSTGGERRNDQNDQADRQDEANNDGPEDRED